MDHLYVMCGGESHNGTGFPLLQSMSYSDYIDIINEVQHIEDVVITDNKIKNVVNIH